MDSLCDLAPRQCMDFIAVVIDHTSLPIKRHYIQRGRQGADDFTAKLRKAAHEDSYLHILGTCRVDILIYVDAKTIDDPFWEAVCSVSTDVALRPLDIVGKLYDARARHLSQETCRRLWIGAGEYGVDDMITRTLQTERDPFRILRIRKHLTGSYSPKLRSSFHELFVFPGEIDGEDSMEAGGSFEVVGDSPDTRGDGSTPSGHVRGM